MSSLKINFDINKLTHESLEIRLRTFEQLSSKLTRALAHNESVEIKPGDLCKQLIRWFGFTPPQQPSEVLNLLKSIIESPKYGPKAIDKLGADKLVKELRKIQTLFDCYSTEFIIIKKIKYYLRNNIIFKENIANPTKLDEGEDFDQYNKVQTEKQIEYIKDYETSWSQPSSSDYTSMKFLSDILINKLATDVEIENALCHIQFTMIDYPPEYMLQSPHIFQKLLQLYDERNSSDTRKYHIDSVAAAMLQFLFTVEKKLKLLRKPIIFKQESCGNENRYVCQLFKIEKALTEIFNASIFHLESHAFQGNVSSIVLDVIFMVVKLLGLMKTSRDAYLLKIASVIDNLTAKLAETEHIDQLRLYQLLLIFLLQDAVQKDVCRIPSKLLTVVELTLRDYTMKVFFTKRHQLAEEIAFKAEKCLSKKYQLLKFYEGCFQTSVQMLTNDSRSSCGEIIKEGYTCCEILDVLQSKELVDVLFGAVMQCLPLYHTNHELKSKAIKVLLKLLNLTCMPLKLHLYKKVTDVFKKHVGCLMTGERYISECSNEELLNAQVIGIPLNTEILLQIVYDNEDACEDIKSNCSKILELFLQSLMLGTQLSNILPIVMPVLPLLNCCTFSEKVVNLLLKLFDPDLRQLPFICVLQGNVGILFHSNAKRRCESLTRLIYTLNSLKSAENYEPSLLQIIDTIPNDVCVQSTPREYKNIFNNRLPVGSDIINSLKNLLQLLESIDVEPLVRKTTLMQINVLCNSWCITAELCKAGACFLILQALENSLQKSCALDYTDSVIPAIGILNKVMLCDTSVRCELSVTPNIYILLLRSLIIFHSDIRLRQDATMCLFQLLFSPQLTSTENNIEGPFILRNIITPININFHSALRNTNKIHWNSYKLSQTFDDNQYWRMVVASSFCDGLKNITQKSLNILKEVNIRDDLKLTSEDVRFIRATQPDVALHHLLKEASNATNHRSLVKVFKLLKHQLIVLMFKDTVFVTNEFCTKINNIMKKYLQIPPSNYNELELYEILLDVVITCLKIPLKEVVLDIFKSLSKYPHHTLITILIKNEGIPLRLYEKIATVLRILIGDHKYLLRKHFNAYECSSFCSNLFGICVERSLQLFEMRNLQCVRCLLSLLTVISSCQLGIADQLLFFYSRRFIQLSLALKSFTQTGAQWHRYCLLIVLQLRDQMQNPYDNFRMNSSYIKFLSGLCGHTDGEVRTLAWSILYATAKTNAMKRVEMIPEQKSCDISGSELLINELSYLPGGFMACCLSSLLDIEEAICVRHLAGQLLAILIRTHGRVKEIEKLIEQHQFIRLATDALSLSVCELRKEIAMEDAFTINITTCELISCYSLICIEISQRSTVFLNKLCSQLFMLKLYDIIKRPLPTSMHSGYLDMIGHICRLYTLCYSDNFLFLQRTICRDAVWLQSFCQILFGIVATSNNTYVIFNMLQLFLILCKDSITLEHLLTNMEGYSTEIVKLFQEAFNVKNLRTSLQSCSLSVLSFLLIKLQSKVDADVGNCILNLFESKNVSIISTRIDCGEIAKSDNAKSKNHEMGINKSCKEKDSVETSKSSIAEHLCMSLIQLFLHLYPAKMCMFSTPPNESQKKVTETLALLLKQSTVSQETAQNLKFHDAVIKIFNNFFEKFATMSCSAYVKRNGESKKTAVIKNLHLLLKLLLCWHSSPAMIITDNILAANYNKIIIKIWPWLDHSNDLKMTVLKFCSFLCERSIVVCKQFSSLNNSSLSHSVLQLVLKMMTSLTVKIKANSSDCSTLVSAGLRVLMNCCACLEGRIALNKMHVLNVFDNFYLFNRKSSQLKLNIVIAWLEFWELFSRYDEGALLHHLNGLCSVINKSSPNCYKRLISLRVLRNMAFLNSNRSALITSVDFIYTANEIVSQPIKDSVEEQFLVCVALWKLISGGIKFASIMRGTKLANNLRLLKDNFETTTYENNAAVKCANDLTNVLNIIFKIFNN